MINIPWIELSLGLVSGGATRVVLSKTIRQSNTNTNTNPDKYKVRNPLTRTQVLSQEQAGWSSAALHQPIFDKQSSLMVLRPWNTSYLFWKCKNCNRSRNFLRMNSLIVSIGKLPEWRSLLAGWCRPDQTGIPNSHHLATWMMRMMVVVGIVALLVMMMVAKGIEIVIYK